MSGLRLFAAGFTTLAFVVTLQAALAQDILEQKRQEDAIRAQQIISDANAAIDKSRQLEKSNASQAKSLLEKSLLQVNDTTGLSDQDSADLRRRLMSRLREVSATVREQQASSDLAAKQAADKAARDERERLGSLSGGKSAFDQASSKIGTTNKMLDDQASIRKMTAANNAAILNDPIKAAATGSKEQRITDTFAKITERRKKELTKEETALLKALNSTITVDFEKNKLKFKEFLEFLSEKTGISILPDKAALDEARVEYDTEIVGFKVPKATVRTVLKKVLADLNLTYIIEKGNISIISPAQVKDHLVTRAYPVGDLVMPIDNRRYPPQMLKMMAGRQAMQLIQTIVNSVEPSSWQGVGEHGFGNISYNEATQSIVITHTAEMHYSLGGALGR